MNPAPNDLCFCGHTFAAHNPNSGACMTYRCECYSYVVSIATRLNYAERRVRLLEAALQALYDRQNGPPLLAPRHRAAWEAAMEQARAALAGGAALEDKP